MLVAIHVHWSLRIHEPDDGDAGQRRQYGDLAVLDLWLQPSIDESLEARDAGVDNVPPVSGIDLPVTVPGANAPANP